MSPSNPAHWIDWLCRRALPLWRGSGFDRQSGSFVERLSLAGAPQIDVPRRLMVQARQIHVYATAARQGWDPEGADLALRAGDCMIARYASGRDGWIFSCMADGTVTDPRRDLYAYAFVLLALASLIRLGGQARHVQMVHTTLAFLDREMAHPLGGYHETWPQKTLPRRQNPHMHLFEALLALRETGLCGDMTPRIASLIALFDRHFFATDDVLTEDYDENWTPLNHARAFEPGHHFEWCWLLVRYAEMTGNPMDSRIDRLLIKGLLGCDNVGNVVETVGDGMPDRNRRLWGATEAAKALTLSQGIAARPLGNREVLKNAWLSFIAPAPLGAWIDRLDSTGQSLVDYVPASSLYHITTALDYIWSTSSDRRREPEQKTGKL